MKEPTNRIHLIPHILNAHIFMRVEGMRGCKKDLLVVMLHNIIIYHHISKNARDTHVRGGHAVWYKREKEKEKDKNVLFVMLHNIVIYYRILTEARDTHASGGDALL